MWNKIKMFLFTFVVGFILGGLCLFNITNRKGEGNQQFNTITNTIDDGAETNRRINNYYQQLKQSNKGVEDLVKQLREQIRLANLRNTESIEHIGISIDDVGKRLTEADGLILEVIERDKGTEKFLRSLTVD